MASEKQYNPEMHTAEHILNQTMVRMFDKGRSFSAHIERKKSKCDYKGFERDLSDDERSELSERINAEIQKNHEITEEWMEKSEAETRFNLSKLPDEAGDEIRIVKVGDYDACPCIGPHVKKTSEIGEFILVSSSFEDDVLRIRYKLKRPV